MSRVREMKNYFKYSILVTLTLLMFTGIALALPPNIGSTPQPNPYESRPTVRTASTLTGVYAPPTLTSAANMWEGNLATSGGAKVAWSTANNAKLYAYLNFSSFQNAPPETFDITWVSIQIKYQGAMNTTSSDLFRWTWTVGTKPWTNLISDESRFDYNTAVVQTRSFSQLTEPNDGAWSWADVNSIKVSLWMTKVTAWDSKNVNIYEIWVSVYSSPVPPTSSTTMSLQPQTVTGLTAAGGLNDMFFVEVYVNDAVALAGGSYQFTFDVNVLQGDSYILYYPFTDYVFAPLLDNSLGIVSIDFSIPVPNPPALGDPEWQTGVTGHVAVARIYFIVVDFGDGTPMPPNYSWLLFTQSYIFDQQANKIPHTVYHGLYGSDTIPAGTSLVGTSVPRPNLPPPFEFPYEHPITTEWVEQYPDFGARWHLSSWEDNAPPEPPNGILDPSDQIDMTPTDPPGPIQWFHVEQIWGCDADPNAYVYMILWEKIPEFPLGIGVIMALAPMIPIIYLWRTRPKRKVD